MNPEWKYHITLNTPDYYPIECWCETYIGEFNKDWYKLGTDPAVYIMEGKTETVWYFKNEKDIILFQLRWK